VSGVGPALFDLSGRVGLVTGGNSGIGLGYARGLAKAGARVAIWGRDAARNAEAVAELEKLGAEAAGFGCDVASEAEVIAATAATLERFGRIDACFANAGFGLPAPFLDLQLENWNRVLEVNLTGAFLTFREVARHMVARGGGGKLIATSSIGEICGMPRQEAYAASKAALSSLVRALAVELAKHDIQANAILPGWIETPATEPIKQWKALEEQVLRRTPARRWGRPDDLEGVAIYLASEASRFHTGDVLRVDGGYMIF
jgi:NAD(P)-dependent dehydrogenase (short-subunit alcohol dehydrogenase family)